MSIFAVDKDGNRKKIAGVGLPGSAATINGVNTLTVTAGDNIKLNQTDGELKIGVILDNGTIEGSVSLLDDLKSPGTYTWLDNDGMLGNTGGLWNVVVTKSGYLGISGKPSITQTLFGTYALKTKGRVLTRAFYYANSPQWTPWRELASLDQISGVNLLDNWYLLRPVNQRGKAEYTTLGYTIDCWTTTGRAPTVQITENGVVITAPAEGYADFRQRMENPFMAEDTRLSGNYTLSVLTADGLFSSTNYLSKDHRQIGPFPFGKGLAYFLKEGNYWQVLLRVNAGESITLLACKLERGPMQTLARKEGDTWILNDPPPDPALELAKCQRYFVRCGYLQSSILGVGMATGNNEVTMSLPIGPMRANVAATVDNLSDIKITETGLVYGISPTELRTIGPDSLGNLSVFFTLGNNTVTQGKAYKIGMTGGGISFSADL